MKALILLIGLTFAGVGSACDPQDPGCDGRSDFLIPSTFEAEGMVVDCPWYNPYCPGSPPGCDPQDPTCDG